MRFSKYTQFFSYNDIYTIAYNAYSSAIAVIDNERMQLLLDKNKSSFEIEDIEFARKLKKGNFIIEEDVDELAKIRYRMLKNRYETYRLTLTIAPTYDCNFDCVYCFEKEQIQDVYMQEDIQKAIVELVSSQKRNLSELTVIWYGGEPLLAIDIIEGLTDKIKKICGDNHIKYSSYMITNGYLLSRNVLQKLKKANVRFLQITVDGVGEIHDRRRFLKDGKGTYRVIFENLQNGYDLLDKVSLRINVDRENIDVAWQVKKELMERNMMEKIKPYLGFTRNESGCYDSDKCMELEKFYLLKYSMKSEINGKNKSIIPQIKNTFCSADRHNSFVIGADGNLFKCWSDIGKNNRKVGNIKDEKRIPNMQLLEYMLFDPTTYLPCKECNILPLCLGGCPRYRQMEGKVDCSEYKYILEQSIRDYVNHVRGGE